jgi:hypothetical protein
MLGSKQQRRYCRYCGASVRPDDAFCTNCGERRLAPGEGAPTSSSAGARRASSSRFWPPSAGREIVAGVLAAVGVAGLLLGLVYALLALRGAFEDPSVPWTMGLVVFSLVHGGAFSLSIPPGPSLLGIGGSLWLGLPPTSFALLPFVALLSLGRFVARWTQTAIVFACTAAATYALVVGVIAAIGTASFEGADGGATVDFAADPLSAVWRAFLLAVVGALLGTAAVHGPLLPTRIRQVARGALAAIGISLLVTVLLAVVLLVVQGADAPPQQVADGQATQLVREDSPAGRALGGVGVLFALLPALFGTLWLFAHGLPMGLQGAQDLANIPLIGGALADAPLQASLLGNWPGGNAWRLLLLGPVIGLVAGGMLAARGAPQDERWWQGSLVAVPYAAFATLAAVLFRINAEISVSGVILDLALGANLPWLLALVPVGGALGALGGLLAGRGAVWAANPRLAFLATAVLSMVLVVGSLPSALALQPQETAELLSSTSPTNEFPEAAQDPETKTSRTSPNPTPAPASADRREEEASEESLRQAVEDYYEAVTRRDWDYTYENLDSRTRRLFTKEEWERKNQWFADNGSLELSSFEITEFSSDTQSVVSLGPPYSRDTLFVHEDGSWKHRLTEEELALFMAGHSFEEFVKAQEEDSTDDEDSQRKQASPTKQEDVPAPQTNRSPSRSQPQWQTTDPEGPYYHPPQGPCLGQCTDADGRNNADIQGEWMRMSPEEKAAERERNIAARQGEG